MWQNIIIRPPDIVCRGTYILPVFLSSSFFLSSFFRRLISEVAERYFTKIGHIVGSKCNLKTHVRHLGYALPLQIRGPKPPFWTTSQLNGNFNGLYLRNETRQTIGQVRWQPQGVSYIVPKCHKLWSTNGLKLDLHFYPPSVNFAFYFIARLRRQRSANRTQPNFAK